MPATLKNQQKYPNSIRALSNLHLHLLYAKFYLDPGPERLCGKTHSIFNALGLKKGHGTGTVSKSAGTMGEQ